MEIVPAKEIRKLLENHFNIILTSKYRKYDILKVRFFYFYLCNKFKAPETTLTIIGKSIGFHHSTVIYGIKEFDNIYASDKKFAKECDELLEILSKRKYYTDDYYKEVIKGLLLLVDELEALAKPNWELQEQKEYKQAKEILK